MLKVTSFQSCYGALMLFCLNYLLRDLPGTSFSSDNHHFVNPINFKTEIYRESYWLALEVYLLKQGGHIRRLQASEAELPFLIVIINLGLSVDTTLSTLTV